MDSANEIGDHCATTMPSKDEEYNVIDANKPLRLNEIPLVHKTNICDTENLIINSTRSSYTPLPILCSWEYSSWEKYMLQNSILNLESTAEPIISKCPSKTHRETISDNEKEDESQTSESKDVVKEEDWLWGGSLNSRHAVLVFKSSALVQNNPEQIGLDEDASINHMPAAKLHVTYKTLQAETKLLVKLLDSHGLTEVPMNATDFNLLWTGSHPKPDTVRSLTTHQRVNHFPRSYELTRKDRLYKNIERMQHIKGFRHFDFIPQTFVMPAEYRELCNAHFRIRGPWIVKPVASSRGRGISIVNSPDQVPLEEPVVVAKYIGNPLLIGGHKCDLRLYVVVTSFDPLLVYLYEEGLVRFATVPYDHSPRQLWNPCMHLCNYSINKYHCDYKRSDDPTAEDVGHKWTLSALLRQLRADGRDTAILMERIEDLVIKALLSCTQSIVSACRMFVPQPNNCFELYGFDILIDENLKPWLLEVNLSPSLGCDTPLDVRLKSAMLADLLTLVGIPAVDPMLRPTPSSSSSSISGRYSQPFNKFKMGSCRRVNSADTLGSQGRSRTGSSISLTPEESRLVKMARAQYDRRGGFVRIFPTPETWGKYSMYLDPMNGIPCTLGPMAATACNLIVPHNYNSLLNSYLFPPGWQDGPTSGCIAHVTQSQNHRLGRYERILSRGSLVGSSLLKNKISPSEELALSDELSNGSRCKSEVKKLLESGIKLTQGESRKAFSQYLGCVLKRISARPCEKDSQIDLIVRFLQKASSQLRTPYFVKLQKKRERLLIDDDDNDKDPQIKSVIHDAFVRGLLKKDPCKLSRYESKQKIPSQKLSGKDRGAVVAKQLGDFLYLYNRETELYTDNVDRAHHMPNQLFMQFLQHANETDIEEALVLHMHRNRLTKTGAISNGLQVLLRSVPTLSSPQHSNKVRSSMTQHGAALDRSRSGRLHVKASSKS